MTTLWDRGPVPPFAVQLRDYQRAAIDALYAWFDANDHGNPLVVVPTGGGKSVVIAAFVHEVLSRWPDQRILVLTHVKELIEQNYAAMLRAWPGAPAGIYSAGIGRREHDAPVLFAGIQSVYWRAKLLGRFDLVLIDEAHLVPRDGQGMYRQLLGDLTSMDSTLRVIGWTATPFRTDSGRLDEGEDRMFHGVAYSCDLQRMIDDAWLSPVTNRGSKGAAINVAGVRTRAGEFAQDELEARAVDQQLVDRQADELVARGADRKAWLVFCVGIAHARMVAEALDRRSVVCATVFGDTPADERADAIAELRAGELQALVNVGVLTTGFDAPNVDLVALLRPTQSPGLYVQMVGRGLRRAEGKRDCLVLDFGGNICRHGPLDAVRPTADDGGDGEAPARQCAECQLIVPLGVTKCPECGHEFPRRQAEPEHTRPDEQSSLLSDEARRNGGIERWRVDQVLYLTHIGKNDSPILRVEYSGGWHERASEWVCLEHDGYPRRKAEQWWHRNIVDQMPREERFRWGVATCPPTVDLAMVLIEILQANKQMPRPTRVTVDVRGQYPEVLAVGFDAVEEPAAELAGEFDPNGADAMSAGNDDIPF